MVLLQEQQRQLSKDSTSTSNGGSGSSSVKCSFLFRSRIRYFFRAILTFFRCGIRWCSAVPETATGKWHRGLQRQLSKGSTSNGSSSNGSMRCCLL